MKQEEHDQEIRRWQDTIRSVLIRLSGAPDYKIDGSGCDSGDPLDLTVTEIEQAFVWIEDGGGWVRKTPDSEPRHSPSDKLRHSAPAKDSDNTKNI